MALPSNGYIEINDTKSEIRGMMAGAGGTFSGTFSSENVDAVQNVNIRDGAVNAFYGFSFPRGSTSITFTIPYQPFARIAEIILPIEMYEEGDNGGSAVISVYKNGILFANLSIKARSGWVYAGGQGGNIGGYRVGITNKVWYLQSARIMDFNLTEAATYTITFKSGKRSGVILDDFIWVFGQVALTFQGQVTVGFRKR